MKNRLQRGAEILGIDELSDELAARLLQFAEELLRWNSKINLTSITSKDDVVEKHLLDSLVLLRFLKEPARILDLGSGAGIPVIPLALAMPKQSFYSIDSVGKKVNFQKHAKRMFGLQNLAIHCGRIEELVQTYPDWQGFDVVVARAVAHLDDLLEMALPIIATGGVLIAMKGPEGEEELSAIEKKWHGRYEVTATITKYRLPFSGADRCLLSVVKVCD